MDIKYSELVAGHLTLVREYEQALLARVDNLRSSPRAEEPQVVLAAMAGQHLLDMVSNHIILARNLMEHGDSHDLGGTDGLQLMDSTVVLIQASWESVKSYATGFYEYIHLLGPDPE